MTKKTYVLLIVAAVLGGLYVYYFTDWINTPRIQILKSNRPARSPAQRGNTLPVAFTLDGRYELTSVKVLSVVALETNKNPAPLWCLVTKSNSVPLKGFYYGQRIQGMAPPNTNARPQKLEANVPYRLLISAGRARGELDFLVQSAASAGN